MLKRLLRAFNRRIVRSNSVMSGTDYLWAPIDKTKPNFFGWGMITRVYPPWHEGKGDSFSRSFHETNHKFLALVREGTFQLSQFRHLTVDAREEFVRGLGWRHFIVQWSVLWAARESRGSAVALVECGVCDGMTIYFAMMALQGQQHFTCTLFDAWQGMQAENLLSTEMQQVGAYSFLSLDTTKRNLEMFSDQCTFLKGSIPESLSLTEEHVEVNWLHIDMNSAIPTLAALNWFWDRIPTGGLVLFDDYLGEPETKSVADLFFADRNCVVLPLPTGQGICFKR